MIITKGINMGKMKEVYRLIQEDNRLEDIYKFLVIKIYNENDF